MPEFDTPDAISMVVDAYVGDIRIIASDRDTTAVDVRPASPNRPYDVEAAQQSRVDYSAGVLRVKTPRPPLWKQAFTRGYGSIEVVIEAPTGSRVEADTGMGSIDTQGSLGDCRLKSSMGDVRVDTADALDVRSGMGAISVERARRRLDVSTGSGEVRIGRVENTADIKNSNGVTRVGAVVGSLRVKSANGDIIVGTTESDVTATTAAGSVSIGEVVRGSVSLETALGRIEIGIRRGTAALLDINTKFGFVRNELDATDQPEPSDEKAEVRGRTSAGDITVRRA